MDIQIFNLVWRIIDHGGSLSLRFRGKVHDQTNWKYKDAFGKMEDEYTKTYTKTMDFHLRPIRKTDAPDFAHFANNKNIADNLTDAFPHPYTLEDAHKFIDMALDFDPPRIMAIEIEGRAAGAAGIHPMTDVYRLNAELGYWLGEPYWGKGIMSKVVIEMVDYGFRTFDIDRIFARPFGRNIGSQKVLEKTGFVLEARFERTILKNDVKEDELVYAVRRATWRIVIA